MTIGTHRIFGIQHLLAFFIFIGFFAIWVQTGSTEQIIEFKNNKIKLSFHSDHVIANSWVVNTDIRPVKDQWHSLITTDVTGQPFSRHLHVVGTKLTGFWEKKTDEDSIIFTGTAENENLAVNVIVHSADDYLFFFRVEFENYSQEMVEIPSGLQLVIGPGLGESPIDGLGIAEKMYSFVEPVVGSGKIVLRLALDKDLDTQLTVLKKYEWFGLQSRYFALILSPTGKCADTPADITFSYQQPESNDKIPIRYFPLLSIDLGIDLIAPSQKISREFIVFSGPKSITALKSDQWDLRGLLFSDLWNWVDKLCLGLLWLLKIIHKLVKSWGISIIVLAILVRIVMYPFAQNALSSQKKFVFAQKQIQPELVKIKKEYRGGEQSERMLQLYKAHGISPLTGLKPLLIVLLQLPIFIALFHVLGRAFELRDASFLWISTLSEPDRAFYFGIDLPFFGEHLNILPIFMTLTTLLTISMSSMLAVDKSSRFFHCLFLIAMAIGFFLLFYTFPSGMVLYWTMANILHLMQSLVVDRLNINKTTQTIGHQ